MIKVFYRVSIKLTICTTKIMPSGLLSRNTRENNLYILRYTIFPEKNEVELLNG